MVVVVVVVAAVVGGGGGGEGRREKRVRRSRRRQKRDGTKRRRPWDKPFDSLLCGTMSFLAMRAEKLPFLLPAVFTIGPRLDDEDSLVKYAKLVSPHEKLSSHIKDLVHGIIEAALNRFAICIQETGVVGTSTHAAVNVARLIMMKPKPAKPATSESPSPAPPQGVGNGNTNTNPNESFLELLVVRVTN
ncbi:hypothetical protein Vadar_003870 [Vaccinium darrowii]|uniref:Uncharacterized protein n=1 Tax=Vaccinium darrowii TaxID=229202 RepID=A0ACB7XY15_9ERIC|nr:hypothetical protein Vadar_003870 [Vaccinium darrowii]